MVHLDEPIIGVCWNSWSGGRKKEVKILIFGIFILEWKNTPRGVKGVGAATLYRKLPPKVSDRTILQYKEESDKKSVKNPKDSEEKGCGVLEVWTNWASGKATYLGK